MLHTRIARFNVMTTIALFRNLVLELNVIYKRVAVYIKGFPHHRRDMIDAVLEGCAARFPMTPTGLTRA